jgi:site-specific recombinase XerD
MEKLNPLFALVHDFFKVYLPNERKLSPNTIRAYRKSLELLLDYVKDKKSIPLKQIKFDMINRKIVTEFLDYLERERGCSVSTRNHRLHCIRAFYTYAAESDVTIITHWDEVKKVDTAKTPKKLVEHMSETAVAAVLDQPDIATQKGRRDMFLMLFLFKTGARIQELLDIRLRDIQFGNAPRVTLHGKGSKTRNIPLRENIVNHLREYIKAFHSSEGIYSDQHLFFAEKSGGRKKRLSEDTVRHFVKQYGVEARLVCPEVSENVHPHLFRHSFAMSMYQNGVDLTLLSQWLGHANLSTTLIYAHADTEQKRKAIEKAVPIDSPLKEHINADRYKIDDDETLKLLIGLK